MSQPPLDRAFEGDEGQLNSNRDADVTELFASPRRALRVEGSRWITITSST